MYVCICVFKSACLPACMYLCVCVCMHACMHARMHLCLFVWILFVAFLPLRFT